LLTLRCPHNKARDRSGELSASNAICVITRQGKAIVVSFVFCDNGIGAAILIGAVAGLWPALSAARMPSTEAMWSV
jgi:hypothetical protein